MNDRKNMTTLAQTLRQQLALPDPFDKFPAGQFPSTLKGGIREAEFMRHVLEIANPRLIIEVGSWKGDSAALIASHLANKGIDGALVCVDTWLGGIEHIGSEDPNWGLKQFSKHGYPTLYYNFLANMAHAGLQRFIIPIPNTSMIAGRYLQSKNIVADLIYIDASHDEDDVYADLQTYWPLLRQGGVLLGDDWNRQWYGVICATNKFAKEKGLGLQAVGDKWLMQKP